MTGGRDTFGGFGMSAASFTSAGTLTNCCSSSASARVASSPRNGLPWNPFLPSVQENPLPLQRAGQDHRRLPLGRLGLVQCREHGRDVVAVDDDGVPAEGAPAVGERLHVVPPHRRAALAERVDVGEAAEVVEVIMLRDVGRFPDGAFGRFAVAQQHVGAVLRLDPAGVQRDPDRGTDALSERAGGDVDERQPGRRMAFEVRPERAELQQFAAIEDAGLRPRRVQDRRRVPLREHEPVAVGVVRVLRIPAHPAEEDRRHELGRRAAARRMAAAGLGGGAHGVDPQLGRDVLQGGDEHRSFN